MENPTLTLNDFENECSWRTLSWSLPFSVIVKKYSRNTLIQIIVSPFTDENDNCHYYNSQSSLQNFPPHSAHPCGLIFHSCPLILDFVHHHMFPSGMRLCNSWWQLFRHSSFDTIFFSFFRHVSVLTSLTDRIKATSINIVANCTLVNQVIFFQGNDFSYLPPFFPPVSFAFLLFHWFLFPMITICHLCLNHFVLLNEIWLRSFLVFTKHFHMFWITHMLLHSSFLPAPKSYLMRDIQTI